MGTRRGDRRLRLNQLMEREVAARDLETVAGGRRVKLDDPFADDRGGSRYCVTVDPTTAGGST